MDSSTLVAVVFAIVAALLGYVYLTARADRQKAGQEAFTLLDDEVEMPDPSEWEKIKAAKPAKPGKELELWHKQACAVLLRRAQAGLRPFHLARRRLNEFAYLKQNEKHLGKAVSESAWASAQARLQQCEQEHERVRAEAAWLQPGQPGWDQGIYQDATDALRGEHEPQQPSGKHKKQHKKQHKQQHKQQPKKDHKKDHKKGADAGSQHEEEASESEEAEPQDLASRFEGGSTDADTWWLRPLRFKVKERVWCNMGPQGWLAGHVVSDWCLPYVVIMDNGARASCPADVPQLIRADEPEESELAPVEGHSHGGVPCAGHGGEAEKGPAGEPGADQPKPKVQQPPAIPLALKQLWRPYRFRPGDRVEVKVTNQHNQEMWLPCVVAMHNFRQNDWPPERIAAYMVFVEVPNQQQQPATAFVAIDHESAIRARQK